MKKKSIIIAGLFLLIIVMGYVIQRRTENGGTAVNLSTTERENILAQFQAEEYQPRNYPFDKRAELIGTMKVELVDIQKELDLFSAKIDKSETSDSVRGDRKASLASMKDKLDRAKQQLDKLKGANESDWDSTDSAFKKLYFELKNSIESTRVRLNSNTES